MSLGERGRGDGVTGRRGECGCGGDDFSIGFASKYCCRPLAASPFRRVFLLRRVAVSPCPRAAAFSLCDCGFKFLARVFKRTAFIERAAQVAMSFCVVAVAKIKCG